MKCNIVLEKGLEGDLIEGLVEVGEIAIIKQDLYYRHGRIVEIEDPEFEGKYFKDGEPVENVDFNQLRCFSIGKTGSKKRFGNDC